MGSPIDLTATARRALIEQREHGRRLLAEVVARFEAIGERTPDPAELVALISDLERELRWLLDELDRLDEESAARN